MLSVMLANQLWHQLRLQHSTIFQVVSVREVHMGTCSVSAEQSQLQCCMQYLDAQGCAAVTC